MAVAKASQNRFFLAGLEQIRSHIEQGIRINRTLSLESNAARLARVQDEHRSILTAIQKGDAGQAAVAMYLHLKNSCHRLFSE